MENKKNLYEETLRKLRENKNKRLSGEIIAIPWNLPRLSRVLPGIEPEKITIVTATTKAGKTQLGTFLFVFQPIDYLFEHPECNLDIRIFYFSLEISREAIMRQAMAYRMFSKYGIVISPQRLLSVFKDYVLDDKIESLIETEKPWFDFLESKLDVQDEIRNATAIFKYLEGYFLANGIWTYKNVKWDEENRTIRDKYIFNNQNIINVMITDHISLIPAEGGLDVRQTIGRFSSEYCLALRDKYKMHCVLIQQQVLTGDQQQFTSGGKSIMEKLKPDASNLATNKEVARDADAIFGLFNPHKYGFDSYKDYDLSRLKDNHREFIIIANRNGISSASIDLYFQGASAFFSELPKPEDIKESDYITIEQIRNKTV